MANSEKKKHLPPASISIWVITVWVTIIVAAIVSSVGGAISVVWVTQIACHFDLNLMIILYICKTDEF